MHFHLRTVLINKQSDNYTTRLVIGFAPPPLPPPPGAALLRSSILLKKTAYLQSWWSVGTKDSEFLQKSITADLVVIWLLKFYSHSLKTEIKQSYNYGTGQCQLITAEKKEVEGGKEGLIVSRGKGIFGHKGKTRQVSVGEDSVAERLLLSEHRSRGNRRLRGVRFITDSRTIRILYFSVSN